MDRQYVRQSSASASRAFCSSLVTLAAERIKLQRVVTNSCGPPAPLWPFFPFTNEHCGCRGFTQAQNNRLGRVSEPFSLCDTKSARCKPGSTSLLKRQFWVPPNSVI